MKELNKNLWYYILYKLSFILADHGDRKSFTVQKATKVFGLPCILI